MNYSDAERLMSNKKFKDTYKSYCNGVMESQGILYSQWDHHVKNNLFGLKDKYGKWCWRNTINTHPNCFVSLYNFYNELGGDPIDFFDDNMNQNIKRFWDFLGYNWRLIFTDEVESKYFYELRLKTNKSWSKGQITTIAFLYVFREIFNDKTFRKIKFSLERGDKLDFKGIDVELITILNEHISIQIKSGTFEERSSGYKIQSSINDLRSESTHYCFVDLINDEVIVFKNIKNLIEDYPNFFLFNKELFVNSVKLDKMSVAKKLYEILTFCAQNNIVFDLIKLDEKENNVEIVLDKEKTFTINISDYKDENLYNLLDEKYKELQQLLN